MEDLESEKIVNDGTQDLPIENCQKDLDALMTTEVAGHEAEETTTVWTGHHGFGITSSRLAREITTHPAFGIGIAYVPLNDVRPSERKVVGSVCASTNPLGYVSDQTRNLTNECALILRWDEPTGFSLGHRVDSVIANVVNNGEQLAIP